MIVVAVRAEPVQAGEAAVTADEGDVARTALP